MHHKSAHAKHVEEGAAGPQLQLGESSDAAAAAAVPTAAAAAAEGAAAEGGTAAGGLAEGGVSSGIQAGEGAGVAAGRAGSAAAAAAEVAEREAELDAVGFGLGSGEARTPSCGPTADGAYAFAQPSQHLRLTTESRAFQWPGPGRVRLSFQRLAS